MTISDIVKNIEHHNEEALIYAKRIDGEFLSTSEAVLVDEPEEETLSTKEIAAKHCPGFEYFLEVFLVKDLLEELNETPGFTSLEQQVAKIIHYAKNDAM